MEDLNDTQKVTMIAKWGKERITLPQLSKDTTIEHVKSLLSEKTGVLPKRQKLVSDVFPAIVYGSKRPERTGIYLLRPLLCSVV